MVATDLVPSPQSFLVIWLGFPDLLLPTEALGVKFAQVVHLLQDGTCAGGSEGSLYLPVQHQECGGNTRGQARTPGEEERQQTRLPLGETFSFVMFGVMWKGGSAGPG